MDRKTIKRAVAKVLDYTFNFEFVDLMVKVFEDMGDDLTKDAMEESINNNLIYDNEQWIVLKGYCRPSEVDFDQAMFDFEMDCSRVLDILQG